MNININPISNIRYQSLKLKSSTKPEEPTKEPVLPNYKNYSNINFTAKVVKLKKPQVESTEIQMLSNKISNFLEKIPHNFNIKKPIEMKVGTDILAFTIDKTEENKTKLLIKRKQFAEKLENWESSKDFDEILSIVLNNNGQMVEGCYTKPNNYKSVYLFERSDKNIRRLKYSNITFTPTAGDNNVWKAVNKDERLHLGNNVPFFPEDYKLRELFYELVKLDTAL